MNKSIPFFIKILTILLLGAGIMFPLLTGSVSTSWISDAPTGAPADLDDATIFEIGVLSLIINEITYDEANSEFILSPAATGNEFVDAISMMQMVAMVAIGVALFFFVIGALVHLKKPSKFASFLTFLGIIIVGGIAALIFLFQSMILEGMAHGGTLDGSSVYLDNVFNDGGTIYTWRFTATLSLGYAVYALIAAAALSFIGLFLKGEYDEY
jgi:hypothetical protein